MSVAYTYTVKRRINLKPGIDMLIISGEAVGDASGGYVGTGNVDLAPNLNANDEVWFHDCSFWDDDVSNLSTGSLWLVSSDDFSHTRTGGSGVQVVLASCYLYSAGAAKVWLPGFGSDGRTMYLGKRQNTTTYVQAVNTTNTNAKTYRFWGRFLIKSGTS